MARPLRRRPKAGVIQLNHCWRRRRTPKRRSYAAGGAPWYWIVDFPRREIVVFENLDGDFVEVQRITTPTVARGPFPVVLDPGNLP